MKEDLRVVIGNAAEMIRSEGTRALDAQDYESAGAAFTAERWLRLFVGAELRPTTPEPVAAQPEPVKAKKERKAKADGQEPKKRGRKPKALAEQQEFGATRASDTLPPPPPEEANGFGEVAERD